MEKIYNYIAKHKYIDIILILITILSFVLLFSHDLGFVFPDRGREFLLPQKILNGAVPYKDITLIYFPTAYYINAIFYKIFGVSINSLIITQTLLCSIFAIGYYYLAQEFISRKNALLLTLLLIPTCIFSRNDLFSYIVPYSYARTYGCISALFAIFMMVKFLKVQDKKYAYISAILAGFCFSCKMEFLSIILILIIGLDLNKDLKISQYLKILSGFLLFPIIVIGILFLQGVSLHNISDTLLFSYKFATTDVMTEFLAGAGVNAYKIAKIFEDMLNSLPELLTIIFLCFMGLKLKNKYSNPLFLLAVLVIICRYYNNPIINARYWIWLPFLVLGTFVLNIKKLINNDKLVLFLLISSFILSLREFFNLNLGLYGTYSFPLLILSLCVIINKFLSKDIYGIKTKNLVSYILLTLFILYSYCLYSFNRTFICHKYPIKTNKGTFYTNYKTQKLLNKTIPYINKNISKDATILVLPEGNIINYITDRNVDLHCFMMDRLYHDAYGPNEAKNKIAKTKSDYIIIVNYPDNNFHRKHLYLDSSSSKAAKYIFKNYKLIKTFTYNEETKINILKNKTNTK